MTFLKYTIFLLSSFIFVNIVSCQNIERVGPSYQFKLFKNSPVSTLAKAVEKEDTLKIRELVIHDLTPIDWLEPKFGNSLLTLAILNKKNLAMKSLLSLGANPNIRSKDNASPFLEACFYSTEISNIRTVLELLIRYGADVNSFQLDTTLDQFGEKKHFSTTALGTVCLYGNLAACKVLVENGASLTNYGENEHSLISTAVLGGKLDIVKYLMIEKGAPIPDYVVIRQPGNKNEMKMTIVDILSEPDYSDSPESTKLKAEIIQFLIAHKG
jgi:ankyrin repeat protein